MNYIHYMFGLSIFNDDNQTLLQQHTKLTSTVTVVTANKKLYLCILWLYNATAPRAYKVIINNYLLGTDLLLVVTASQASDRLWCDNGHLQSAVTGDYKHYNSDIGPIRGENSLESLPKTNDSPHHYKTSI